MQVYLSPASARGQLCTAIASRLSCQHSHLFRLQGIFSAGFGSEQMRAAALKQRAAPVKTTTKGGGGRASEAAAEVRAQLSDM